MRERPHQARVARHGELLAVVVQKLAAGEAFSITLMEQAS
jgi:hypothetical protein